LLPQATMRLLPGWRFEPVLHPMNERRLVAPVGQPRHHMPMRTRAHKRAHCRFIGPDRAGPEGAIGITQDKNSKISIRALGLAGGEQ